MIEASLSLAEAGRRAWDAVVVGAGPAGSVAAHGLARRGLAVLLVDRALFPRGKVCGCCLNGRALASLHQAGLGGVPAACGAVPLEAMQLASGGRSARLPLAGAVLSREAFDAALVREAIRAGVAFLPGTLATLGSECSALRLTQSGDTLSVMARVLLAADGLGGTLLARVGLKGSPTPGARIGAGVVAATAPAFYYPGSVFMACGTGGYLGMVRLEDGRLDLAAALDVGRVRDAGGPGALAAQLLAETGWPAVPHLKGLPWKGTPSLTRQPRRLAAERLFVLGDAAGYVEPFTGEGMAWAVAAAVAVVPLAVRAARHWQPSFAREWAGVYRRVVRRRQFACRAAAAVLRHPLLVRILVSLLGRVPGLAAPVLRHLNGRPAISSSIP